MPKTGKMFADKIVLPGYSLPDAYRWWRLNKTSNLVQDFLYFSFLKSFRLSFIPKKTNSKVLLFS
jgi:hypothetical protein